ncbi:hypothetical protein [Bacillus phage vB_BanS-Thrax1]|nr:hypothetical protein [Bacillus phage vB_BanS-Thrax1]
MIVAHLIGGNEVKVRIGDKIEEIREGVVIINGEQLEISYRDLAYVCGSIELGALDTSTGLRRDEEDVQRDYINLLQEWDDEYDEDFVIDNHLTAQVSFSTYQIDFENKTLTLEIETYE